MRLHPWAGRIPWRSKWPPTPVFLLGESHGQRSPSGYRPWGRKESDRTEQLSTHACMRTHPSHGRKATGNTQGTRDNVARFPGKHHLAGHPPWALKREVDGCCVCESCSVMPDSLRLHGILQARILEWVAFPFSRVPSQLRNRPGVSCIAGGFLTS